MTDMEKKATTPKKPRTPVAKMTEPRMITTKMTEPKTPAAKMAEPRAARSKVTQMKASHDEIARLAHRYWTERGGQHGHDTEDWLRAERELWGKAS
jgi:hypothetical protein